jgi:O-antigen/teichoic acid export membrane protein
LPSGDDREAGAERRGRNRQGADRARVELTPRSHRIAASKPSVHSRVNDSNKSDWWQPIANVAPTAREAGAFTSTMRPAAAVPHAMPSVRSGLLSTLTTDATLLVCGFMTGALVARFLLPEGRGALAAVLFWPHVLGSAGLLSLNEAVTVRIARRPDRSGVIVASAFWLALVQAGLVAAAGYLLVPFLLSEERAHLVALARTYLLVFIPSHFLAMSLLGAFQGCLRFSRYNPLRLVVAVTYLGGIVLLWATNSLSVRWVVAMNCVGTVAVAAACVVLQRDALAARPSLHEALALARAAVPIHAGMFLLLLAAEADRFVVLTLWDDVALGHYVVALAVASSGLGVVTGTVQKVLFPHLANCRERARQAQLLASGIRQTTAVVVGLSVPLLTLMPWLLPAVFGVAFREAVATAWILLVAYWFIALNNIVVQGFWGLGEARTAAKAGTIGLVAFLILAWPLAWSFGLPGVAAARGLASAAAFGYLVSYLQRDWAVRLGDLWGLNARTIADLWHAGTRRDTPLVEGSR